MKQEERFIGALVGLAVGDAVGAAVEFQSPGSFREIKDMVGGGRFNLKPGEWTDDTSMALCLAESLIAKRRFDPVDQLERYVRWWREGHLSSTGEHFDIGLTTQRALEQFEKTHESYCGSTDPNSAGNGSLIRLAPVPLFYSKNPSVAIERSGDSSRTTHGALTAVDACRFFAGLIVGAVNGASKDQLLTPRFSPVEDY